MKALLIRLEGPFQSWGTMSRFSERDTQLEPSKSGIVGLLCAALGHTRDLPLDRFNDLELAIRVDQEGIVLTDYHTVGGGTIPDEALARYGLRKYGVSKANGSSPDTALSRRAYLADARFTVALGGVSEEELVAYAAALRSPVFPLFLGRKSFVPSAPVLLNSTQPLVEGESLVAILESTPWQPHYYETTPPNSSPKQTNIAPKQLRLVFTKEAATGASLVTSVASLRKDQPRSFTKGSRQFEERTIYTQFTRVPIEHWQNKHQLSAEEATS